MSNLYKGHWALVALCVLGLGIMAWGITPSFSADDYIHLDRNLHFSHLGEALAVFGQFDGREYRPMVRLSLWLNGQMGETALPFRATNLLLFLAAMLLLYRLLTQLGVATGPRLAALALFALHPIHTTNVHFVMGRTDMVMAVFYLGTLVAAVNWFRQGGAGRAALTGVLFVGALMSKESAITLPVMLLAVLLMTRPPSSVGAAVRSALYLWPFALLAGVYLIVRVVFWATMDANVSVYTQFSVTGVVANYAQWAFALLYPFDLYQARFAVEGNPAVFLRWAVPAVLAFGLMLLWLFWPARRQLLRQPLVWLGAAWILITLLPMSGGNAHRWYLYLPSVGLSLILAGLCHCVPDGLRRRVGQGLLGLVLLVCALETLRLSHIWQEQGRVSSVFLAEVERQGLHQESSVLIVNVPFGYKSSFLFTFSSLEQALELKHGQAPKIGVLSYINLGDSGPVTVEQTDEHLRFEQQVGPYDFFLLPPATRRLAKPVTQTIEGVELRVDHLAPGGSIGAYRLTALEALDKPLYYFDGERLHRYE